MTRSCTRMSWSRTWSKLATAGGVRWMAAWCSRTRWTPAPSTSPIYAPRSQTGSASSGPRRATASPNCGASRPRCCGRSRGAGPKSRLSSLPAARRPRPPPRPRRWPHGTPNATSTLTSCGRNGPNARRGSASAPNRSRRFRATGAGTSFATSGEVLEELTRHASFFDRRHVVRGAGDVVVDGDAR